MKFFRLLFSAALICSMEYALSADSLSTQSSSKDFGIGKINTTQAKAYIGKDACVCGKVVSTKFNENGKSNITYLNLDKKFPQQIFTLLIYGADRKNFSYKPEEFLLGKTICIRGKVAAYKGMPQIIANKEKQVEIIE